MGWPYQQKPPMGWPLDLDNSINDGLVGLWLFNEGSGGQVYDLSGNNHTGTFGVASPTWTNGKYGSAVLFGADDYINLGTNNNLGIFNQTGFTIKCLVNLSDNSADKIIISRGMPNIIWMIWYDVNDDRWEFFVRDSEAGLHYAKGNSSPSLNTWYNIVCVFDGSKISISIDEIEQSTTSAITTPGDDSGDNTYIGFREEHNDSFSGILDLPIILNRALSASERALLYREPFCMFKDPAEIPLFGQYYTVTEGGIMTPNTRYWGAL